MVKTSLVVLLGLLAAGLLRRRSASTRHWVLAWTLACAAAMPAVEFVAPSWDAPLSVAWIAAPASESRLVFGVDSGGSQGTLHGSSLEPASSPATLHLSPLRRMWLLGSTLSVSLLIVGLVRLARIVAQGTPVEQGPWMCALADIAVTSPRAAVRLVQSQHPALLFTWGLRRPTIVLPASAPTWPAERIRAVLGHELAHVQRRDWAVQTLADLVRCAHWFNPLVWLACRQLRVAGEQACDDAVLNMGVRGPDYAGHLLDVARLFRRSGRPSVLPAMTMVRPSSFERRVSAMLKSGVDRTPISRLSARATASAMVILTIPLAGMTAEQVSNPPATVFPTTQVIAEPQAAATASQASPAAGTSLVGTVRDPLGKTMPDVVVDISKVDTPGGLKPKIRTGPDGRFEITGLPPGEYEVASTRPGFKRNLLRVPLEAGAPAALNIVLQIGSLTETIVVTASKDATSESPKRAPVRVDELKRVQPEPDPCDNSPLGGCLTPPRKLVDVKPAYPRALAERGASADVVVKATLGVDGRLKDFRPDAGPDPAFVEAVLAAVRQWQFSPVRLNGVVQECLVTVTVKFSVRQDS